jgi:hypothetical protein
VTGNHETLTVKAVPHLGTPYGCRSRCTAMGEAGVPEVMPAGMGYLGWQESLQHLAMLVESGPPAEEAQA